MNGSTHWSSFRPYYAATVELWRHHNNSKKTNKPLVVTKTTMDDDNAAMNNNTMAPQEEQNIDYDDVQSMEYELDYIRTIQEYCWSQTTTNNKPSEATTLSIDIPTAEGNFWLLLYRLRDMMVLTTGDRNSGSSSSSSSIGYNTLLWEDDVVSKQQYHRSIQVYIEQLVNDSNNASLTPAAILQRLYNTEPIVSSSSSSSSSSSIGGIGVAPIPLLRRKQILLWLQECFHNLVQANDINPTRIQRMTQIELPQNNTTSTTTPSTQEMMVCGLYGTNNDTEILRSCLYLLLSGLFPHDAIELVQEHKLHRCAAIWKGMIPHGHQYVDLDVKEFYNDEVAVDKDTTKIDYERIGRPKKLVSVGNPNRHVWRRMMHHHSEQLWYERQLSKTSSSPSSLSSSNEDDSELAIAALLSLNIKTALRCNQLRSWEGGLYTFMRCMMDRIEDDVLYRFNNYRRLTQKNGGPMFPGTEHEKSEMDHLQETESLSTIDEGEAIKILNGSPFGEMRGDDVVHKATASFIIGKSAIVSYIEKCVDCIGDLNHAELRFVTHIALFLDIWSSHRNNPIVIANIGELKDALVLQYLNVIASYEDLWYMIVFYASLLPVPTIMEHLPSLLVNIEHVTERKVVVKQLRGFLPEQNLDVQVLRRLVTLITSDTESVIDIDEVMNNPTTTPDPPSRKDIRKMEAVLWLSIQADHFGEYLNAANTILRKFFLQGRTKISCAVLFVDDVLDENFLSTLDSIVEDDGTITDDTTICQLGDAKLEHLAYRSCIDAIISVQRWDEVLRETNSTLANEDFANDGIDKSALNKIEASIGDNMERRKIVDIKRTTTRDVVTAAEAAVGALRQVLEHPGGWLVTSYEDSPFPNDIDAITRRTELDQIRNQLLPIIVNNCLEVCTETASWMSKSLDDAAKALRISGNATIRAIDDAVSDTNISVEISSITPRYWTQKALELAKVIFTEKFIRTAFCTIDYNLLRCQLAETAALDCMYRRHE